MAQTVHHKDEMTDAYRSMVCRLMIRQLFAEMATSEIFGHSIELAPTWRDKVRQAQFCREEAEHSESVAEHLEDLGVDLEQHMAERQSGMKFFGVSEELNDWTEVVVFSFCADRAGSHQLMEYRGNSYAPWAKTMDKILAEEEVHQAIGNQQLERICQTPEGRARAQRYLENILPVVVKRAFGRINVEANRYCIEHGLKTRRADEVQSSYFAEVRALLDQCGLQFPDLEKASVQTG